jgi:hypothetical protein
VTITAVTPGQTTFDEAPDIRLSGLEPRVSDWISRFHEAVLDRLAAAVRDRVGEDSATRPGGLAFELLEEIVEDAHWTGALPETTWDDADYAAQAFVATLVEYACKYSDTDIEDLDDTTQARLVEIGTGRGPLNTGLAGLLRGPLAVADELVDEPPTIRVTLDGAAWR